MLLLFDASFVVSLSFFAVHLQATLRLLYSQPIQPHEVHDASTETMSMPPAEMVSGGAGTGFDEQKMEHNTGYAPASAAAGQHYAAGQDYPAVQGYNAAAVEGYRPAVEGYPPAVEGYPLAVEGYAPAAAVEGYAGVEGYAAARNTAVPSPGSHGGVDGVQNYPEVSVAVHVGAAEEVHFEEIDQSMGAPPSGAIDQQQPQEQEQQEQRQPQQEEANGLLGIADEVKESLFVLLICTSLPFGNMVGLKSLTNSVAS